MEREEFINEKKPTIHGDSKWYRKNLSERMSHAYMKIDGSYDWPNSEEGDLFRLTRQMLVVMDQEQQKEITWNLKSDGKKQSLN